MVFTRSFRKSLSLITLACALLFFGAPAVGAALSLDQAKSQGLVGEKLDGYLGAVMQPASAEVKNLISDINEKRKEKYSSIAKQSSTDLATVELLAGKKAIENTEPGKYIELTVGKWVKK